MLGVENYHYRIIQSDGLPDGLLLLNQYMDSVGLSPALVILITVLI